MQVSDETRWKEYIHHSLVETTIMRDILLLAGIPEFTKRFNPNKVLLVGREGILIEELLMIPISDLFN